MTDKPALRLLAVDSDDLKIISAACQDSVCKPADLVYDSHRRRFHVELNRFRWENQSRTKGGERVRSVLSFEDVSKVRARGLPGKHADLVLSLLSVDWVPDAENPPAGEVKLMFAGDGELSIQADCLDVTLADTSNPWPTRNRPKHKD